MREAALVSILDDWASTADSGADVLNSAAHIIRRDQAKLRALESELQRLQLIIAGESTR